MRKHMQLRVPEPCHEKWENMSATSTGNFCQSCNKTVIDFTGMTDNQLMEYFKNHHGNACGRFNDDQLGKQIEIPVKRISWLRYFFTLSFPAMLLSLKADAQRVMKKSQQAVVMVDRQLQPVSSLKGITLTGCVRGEKGEPVPFASVSIQGTQLGVSADSNGAFILHVPGHDRTIEISAVGYEKQVLPVTGSTMDVWLRVVTAENIVLPTIEMLCRRDVVTMGAMVSGISYYSRWEKRPAIVPELVPAMNFFPNPVKRNGLLTIRFKKPVSNNQQIIIYNSAGIQLQKEILGIDQPIMETKVNLHLNAAGYFIIQVIDSKTKNKTTAKLIVE